MKWPIRLSKDSREPIYHQIEGQVKALIAGGQLTAGTPLPSIRSLSKDLEVSVITTRRAYQDLEQQGFIETIQGKGTFVAKVAGSSREKVKTAAVRRALEDAVETARRYDYSYPQIEELFSEVLEQFRKKEENA